MISNQDLRQLLREARDSLPSGSYQTVLAQRLQLAILDLESEANELRRREKGRSMTLTTLGDVSRWLRLHVYWGSNDTDRCLADDAVKIIERADTFNQQIDKAIRNRDATERDRCPECDGDLQDHEPTCPKFFI